MQMVDFTSERGAEIAQAFNSQAQLCIQSCVDQFKLSFGPQLTILSEQVSTDTAPDILDEITLSDANGLLKYAADHHPLWYFDSKAEVYSLLFLCQMAVAMNEEFGSPLIPQIGTYYLERFWEFKASLCKCALELTSLYCEYFAECLPFYVRAGVLAEEEIYLYKQIVEELGGAL